MIADTLEELHAMAGALGLKRAWFQFKPKASGICVPHYDLIRTKRAAAIKLGAIPVDREQAVFLFRCWYAVTKQYGAGAWHIIGVQPLAL